MLIGRHWRALFHRVRGCQIGQMLFFAVACTLRSRADNPVATEMTEISRGAFVLRRAPTLPQLVGEELLTILPLLTIL